MKRTGTIILTVIWFILGITYYSMLTRSMASVGASNNDQASEEDSLRMKNDQVHLPVYFEMDKSLPQKGESFGRWKQELNDAIGDKDTLLIVGLYYSGETNGEILATSRSLAVQRLLSENIDPARLVVDFNPEIQPAPDGLWVKGIKTEIRRLNETQRITAQGIRVPFHKGKINWAPGNETRNKLAEVAGKLDKRSGYTIIVTAHTSASGSADADYELGRKRAWVIKKQLMDLGLDPEKIRTESKGSEEPEFDNASYDGNDRAVVEIRLNGEML